MPTENRSSTIEQHDHIEGIIDMVSVPREWLNSVALLQMPLDELQEQAIQHLCEPCDEPAPQPHPEPIAWMVGTAFWWTKEEAERDAAATGLPIVELGPMAAIAPAQQHHGTPVGEVVAFGKGLHEIAWATGRLPSLGAKLYTHADPAEVERIKAELAESDHAFVRMAGEAEKLRAQLEERDALLRELAEAPPAAMEFRLQQKVKAALSARAEAKS